METLREGFITLLLLTLIATLLIGGGVYLYIQKSPSPQLSSLPLQLASSTDRVSTVSDSTDNQIDLSKTEPRFVVQYEGQGISEELKAIESAARNILIASEPDIAPIAYDASLQAVGHRYGLLRVFHGANGWTVNGDFVIDLVDKTSKRISSAGDLDLYTQDAVVYISSNKITYYKIDSPSPVVLPNSELPSGQTYEAAYISSHANSVVPEEKHVGTKLTISVFDSNVFVELLDNPQFQKMSKKLKEVTFTLPDGEFLVPNN